MPFNRPFKGFYTPGDLIYGFSTTRQKYADTHPVFQQVYECSAKSCSIDEYAINEGERELLRANSIPLPDNLDRFLQVLKSHPKYKSAYEQEGFWIKERGKWIMIQDPFEAARKCKAGLYWAANEQKFQVHFFLDDINFETVVTKPDIYDESFDSVRKFLEVRNMQEMTLCSHYPNRMVKDKSVTNSELRWIYRNRNNQKVQKTIQFWNKDDPCSPPLDRQFDEKYNCKVSHLWLSYVPKNTGMLLESEDRTHAFWGLAKLFNCLHGSN